MQFLKADTTRLVGFCSYKMIYFKENVSKFNYIDGSKSDTLILVGNCQQLADWKKFLELFQTKSIWVDILKAILAWLQKFIGKQFKDKWHFHGHISLFADTLRLAVLLFAKLTKSLNMCLFYWYFETCWFAIMVLPEPMSLFADTLRLVVFVICQIDKISIWVSLSVILWDLSICHQNPGICLFLPILWDL